jgi:hypothetical protein
MARLRRPPDDVCMVRDRSAMPIFTSTRARARHGAVIYAAAIAIVVAAILLRIV